MGFQFGSHVGDEKKFHQLQYALARLLRNEVVQRVLYLLLKVPLCSFLKDLPALLFFAFQAQEPMCNAMVHGI